MYNHDKESVTEVEEMSCEVCLKNIPVSEAKSEEATDYVAYFCGLNCYDKWKGQSLDNEAA